MFTCFCSINIPVVADFLAINMMSLNTGLAGHELCEPLATAELGYDTGDFFQFYALAEENKDCTRCPKFSLTWFS